MKNLIAPITLAFAALAGQLQAQEVFDLWPEKGAPPPLEQMAPLPLDVPDAPEIDFVDIGDVTIERDGQTYKALQWFSDRTFEVTVPTGMYLLGLLGAFYPPDTIDPVALIQSARLVSVEIDDAVIELDDSNIFFLTDFPFEGVNLASYDIFPRFLQTGTYTLRYRWRQVEPFYFIRPFGVPFQPEEDPAPEFEGRRALVAEQQGDEIDGDMLLTYILTVVDAPTAVEEKTWGQLKQSQTEQK